MPFSENQIIVHPVHGPVRVTSIYDRPVKGAPAQYLELSALQHPLTISVPAERAEQLGLRALVSPKKIADLLDLLRQPGTQTITQWSRRVKDYEERMTSGSLEDLCYVIREISRSGTKARASAEGQLLRSAKATFVTEVSLALEITAEEAEQMVDAAALATGTQLDTDTDTDAAVSAR